MVIQRNSQLWTSSGPRVESRHGHVHTTSKGCPICLGGVSLYAGCMRSFHTQVAKVMEADPECDLAEYFSFKGQRWNPTRPPRAIRPAQECEYEYEI